MIEWDNTAGQDSKRPVVVVPAEMYKALEVGFWGGVTGPII